MDTGKAVSELTVGVPHYYYDLLSFYGSSIYMAFWTAVLLVDASVYKAFYDWFKGMETLGPVVLCLGTVALIVLLYIYAQTVQHWSWYVFDNWLFSMPSSNDDHIRECCKHKNDKKKVTTAQKWAIAIRAIISVFVVLLVITIMFLKLISIHNITIIVTLLVTIALTISYWVISEICKIDIMSDKFKAIYRTIKSISSNILLLMVLIGLIMFCIAYSMNVVTVTMLAIIILLYILLIDVSMCSTEDQDKFNIDFCELKDQVRIDLGFIKNNQDNTQKHKIAHWQVLELVLKYNLASGKNLVKEFARSSLAKMNAFNSMIIIFILIMRKCINPEWCLNHTIMGKMFDLNGGHMFSYVVLAFTILMLMFLREYYKRNGRNNKHLYEAYMAVSSDVKRNTRGNKTTRVIVVKKGVR